MIHKAAADPDVCALYSVFGGNNQFSVEGLPQIEEIRNAIRIFNESHRVHQEPNLNYHVAEPPQQKGSRGLFMDEIYPSNDYLKRQKHSFAYGTSFSNLDGFNAAYYLASASQKVYMQYNGSLNLFGPSITVPFVKDMLDKYGVKVHVFKRGKFKSKSIMNGMTPVVECKGV